jgi:hypothetical protein
MTMPVVYVMSILQSSIWIPVSLNHAGIANDLDGVLLEGDIDGGKDKYG